MEEGAAWSREPQGARKLLERLHTSSLVHLICIPKRLEEPGSGGLVDDIQGKKQPGKSTVWSWIAQRGGK